MVYIRFSPSEDSYAALDLYREKLYEDPAHQHLFDFVDMDISDVPKLLTDYIKCRMDISTCEKTDGDCGDLPDKIKARMDAIHPFLQTNNRITLHRMLAYHLNDTLANCAVQISQEDYSDLFDHIQKPLISYGSKPRPPLYVATSSVFIDHFYQEYKNHKPSTYTPYGILYLTKVQEIAKRYLYWILDASSVRFKNLTKQERCRLYSRIFHAQILGSDMVVQRQISWMEPQTYDYINNTYQSRLLRAITEGRPAEDAEREMLEEKAAREEKKSFAQAFAEVTRDEDDLDAELTEKLREEMACAKQSAEPAPFTEYRVDDFLQLIQLEIYALIQSDVIVKRCKYCGRYFLTDRLTVEYCSRIAEDETQPCDVVGPKQSFSKLLNEDAALKAYNRAYKTVYARLRRGSITEEAFNAWKAEARRRLDETRENGASVDEYIAWLKKDIRKWEAKE